VDRLLARAWLGLAFLLGVLALALFASAGSLAFGRAWVYLAVFGGACAFVTGWLVRHDRALLESRTRAGPLAESEAIQRWLQSIASACFVALFVTAGFDFRRGAAAVSWPTSLACDGVVAFGFWIVLRVFRANRFTSAVIEVKVGQRVVETGPYAIVRHPMYAGAALLLLASPPALGSWRAEAFAVALVAVVALRAVREERTLSAQLAGYAEYRARVRYRLVPFVW
jgi:protein-S-isoprenylcysteine O-methyltransferase Ste14